MVTSSPTLHPDIDEVLLTQEAIAARVAQLGRCAPTWACCNPCRTKPAYSSLKWLEILPTQYRVLGSVMCAAGHTVWRPIH